MNTRNASREAQAALEFWQALEYLAPQTPPTIGAEDFVWELDAASGDAAMPWHDPVKQAILARAHPRWRFQVFSGIADGAALVQEARDALGARALDAGERRPPAPAACVVLEVNGSGMATGQVFISTVPWAMACIVRAAGQPGRIDFSGFFGAGGLDEEARMKVKDLLVTLRLLAPGEPDAEPATLLAGLSVDAEDGGAADHGGTLRPVGADDIAQVTELVFSLCGWRPARALAWRIKGVKAPADDAKDKKSQDDPLNSFFAEDLERVADALARGDAGAGLQAYMQGEPGADRIDLERRPDVLVDGVHPDRLPPGCWPATHPLVTAQQFAVNTMMRELSAGSGMFSVNGPPGTGKTTMLKDIVAAVVVRRADVLATFAQPEAAFGARLEIDNYGYPAYALDERLRGFGLVVASANNGAVENITKELPGLNALDPGIDLDYFSAVADSIGAPAKATKRQATRQRWGLVAAVLGNKTNRNQFVSRFWFADQARKTAQNAAPAPDPLRLRSLPSMVASNEHGALPWPEARARYAQASKLVDTLTAQALRRAAAVAAYHEALAALQQAQERQAARAGSMAPLQSGVDAAGRALQAAQAAAAQADMALLAQQELRQAGDTLARQEAVLATWTAKLPERDAHDIDADLARASAERADLDARCDKHAAQKPGLLGQIFRTPFSKRWNDTGARLDAELDNARRHEKALRELGARVAALAPRIAAAKEGVDAARDALRHKQAAAAAAGTRADATPADLEAAGHAARAEALRCRSALADARSVLAGAQAALDADAAQADAAGAALGVHEATLDALGHDLDESGAWDPARLERAALHRAAPYHLPALFDARRALYVAAMELHKAFIVAAWGKLRHTLGAFVNLLGGGIAPGQVAQGTAGLWDAFFLVVPLVSTTFASFPRLFAGIGREQLAWLLIDEAGQAAPQQAAGAIWRARRTVVVGDPLQLEPVVGVPDEIISALLVRCNAEQRWAPPQASAQVLADCANRYGTYLGKDDDGSGDDRVWLGAPLVVHRRCQDPMFAIANAIAYDDMMVHGSARDSGAEGIGPSRWINMRTDQAEGHWVEAQARVALQLVERITGGELTVNGQHKVYVITPFRQVAEKIGELLYRRYKAASNGMSGTVHTFQGKEADHVIFLLCGNPAMPGVISTFAGAKPNLVNVAVTRARRRLYVIGDKRHWTGPGDTRRIYARMAQQLPSGPEPQAAWSSAG